MKSVESAQITEFKHRHADVIAWLYTTCRAQSDNPEIKAFAKKLLNFSAMMDADYGNNLVENIKRKVGINPADKDETNIVKIFAEGHNPNYEAASGWGEYIRKIFTIDIGIIEELFDEIIDGLVKIYGFIKEFYQNSIRKANKLLEEMNVIIESLKNMRSNTPLMVHLQTKIELSQTAELSVA